MTVNLPEYIKDFFENLGYKRIRIVKLNGGGYALEFFNDWDYYWSRFFIAINKTDGKERFISFYFETENFDDEIREHLKENNYNLMDMNNNVVPYPADDIEWEFWKV